MPIGDASETMSQPRSSSFRVTTRVSIYRIRNQHPVVPGAVPMAFLAKLKSVVGKTSDREHNVSLQSQQLLIFSIIQRNCTVRIPMPYLNVSGATAVPHL